MSALNILTVLLPFVAAAAVLPADTPSSVNLSQCRPECKRAFDSCRARDHRPTVPQCKIFVCRVFGNDCTNCNYCVDPIISDRDVDVTISMSLAEEVTPIVTVRDFVEPSTGKNTPFTKPAVCSRGEKICSPDGSHVQECVYSQSQLSWKWLNKKDCGKGCCDYIRGTRTPMCMCLSSGDGLLVGEEAYAAFD